MKTRIAILGAGGRMGRALLRCVLAADDLDVAAAIEEPHADAVGRDAGELAGAGTLGVLVSTDRQEIVNADVVIDFTFHTAAPHNAASTTPTATAILLRNPVIACSEDTLSCLVPTTSPSDRSEIQRVRLGSERCLFTLTDSHAKLILWRKPDSPACETIRSIAFGHLSRDHEVNVFPVIFIVTQALVNLRSCQVRKAPDNVVRCRSVHHQSNNIVNAYTSAFDNGVASADVLTTDNVSVCCCHHIHSLL